jgi:hypothetical protein
MIIFHPAMDRPYLISIDGKYEAGPRFGHGGDWSAMAAASTFLNDAWAADCFPVERPRVP